MGALEKFLSSKLDPASLNPIYDGTVYLDFLNDELGVSSGNGLEELAQKWSQKNWQHLQNVFLLVKDAGYQQSYKHFTEATFACSFYHYMEKQTIHREIHSMTRPFPFMGKNRR